MCLHIAQTACKLFKDTLSVSALGYNKCFVSKGYYNIQTYLPFLEQTHTRFGVTRFTSASASACFLSPFPDLTKK